VGRRVNGHRLYYNTRNRPVFRFRALVGCQPVNDSLGGKTTRRGRPTTNSINQTTQMREPMVSKLGQLATRCQPVDRRDDVSDKDGKLRRSSIRESTTTNAAVKNEISSITQRYFRVWKNSHKHLALLIETLPRRRFCRAITSKTWSSCPHSIFTLSDGWKKSRSKAEAQRALVAVPHAWTIHWQQFWLCVALRIFPPFLFPIIQRRHGDKAKAEIKKAESGNQTRIAQINSWVGS